jgi:hypothetical protein
MARRERDAVVEAEREGLWLGFYASRGMYRSLDYQV